ncbi:hypothetical protein JYB64_20995 [Algoriphagus aestuarii]|nr:hypothetical protein [Algoriphagus aestuarii]
MLKEIVFLVCLMLSPYFLKAQNLPSNLNSKLSKPSISNSISALPSKPEISYLEELKQIRDLKKSYDSLQDEIKELKEVSTDSVQRDSLLQVAKERTRVLLDNEKKTLESLVQSGDIPGEEIKNASQNILNRVEESQNRLDELTNVSDLESLADQNNENLKALTNEWIMPKIEEELTGKVSGEIDPRNMQIPDFYGKGALEELTKNGLPSEIPYDQAKALASEKAAHISDEFIQKSGKDFSKIKVDSLGNIKTISASLEKRRKTFIEPNELKSEKFIHRIGLNLWYDPLTSFGEGFLLDGGVFYGLTHQFSLLGGITWKKQFDEEEPLIRQGFGYYSGIRFAKGNWFAQGTVNRNQVTVTNPAGYESRDYAGKAWASSVAIGRTIPMGKVIRSVVIGSIDPFFNKQSSFYKSRVQLKIGFEIGSFKFLKKEIKELNFEEFEEKKVEEHVVEYFDKNFN